VKFPLITGQELQPNLRDKSPASRGRRTEAPIRRITDIQAGQTRIVESVFRVAVSKEIPDSLRNLRSLAIQVSVISGYCSVKSTASIQLLRFRLVGPAVSSGNQLICKKLHVD